MMISEAMENFSPDLTTFQLASNCIPVRGAVRTLICDLQRQIGRLIPSTFYDFIVSIDRRPLSILEHEHSSADWAVLRKNMAGLISEGYAFWTPTSHVFVPMALDWESPARVTNAIIDIAATSTHDYKEIVGQLGQIGCLAIQFRSFTPLSLKNIHEICQACNGSLLRHVDMILPFTIEFTESALNEFCSQNPLITRMTIYSSPYSKRMTIPLTPTFIDFELGSFTTTSCGQVHEKLFSMNLHHVLESMSFNNCLNRKLSIDAQGEIRNCPSTPEKYGDSKLVLLKDALKHHEFNKYDLINKDHIEGCKDCEFRYVCTDCRAFVKSNDGVSANNRVTSKPSKCHYDPYTARWN